MENRNSCTHCGKGEAKKSCGICKTKYCGEQCQKDNWYLTHKRSCKLIKKIREEQTIRGNSGNEVPTNG